jgi:hypothetical protein
MWLTTVVFPPLWQARQFEPPCLDNLKPQTTYYYTIASMQATGESDGVKSSVNHFTTGLQLP